MRNPKFDFYLKYFELIENGQCRLTWQKALILVYEALSTIPAPRENKNKPDVGDMVTIPALWRQKEKD